MHSESTELLACGLQRGFVLTSLAETSLGALDKALDTISNSSLLA